MTSLLLGAMALWYAAEVMAAEPTVRFKHFGIEFVNYRHSPDQRPEPALLWIGLAPLRAIASIHNRPAYPNR